MKKSTLVEKLSVGFIVVVFLGMVGFGIPFFKGCSKLVDEVEKKGVKGVIEEVWEGKQE